MNIKILKKLPLGWTRRVPAPLRAAGLRVYAAGMALKKRKTGYCLVCGRKTWFCYEQLGSEDVNCIFCVSLSRNRHVALEMMRFFASDGPSLADFCQQTALKKIYLMEAWGGIAPVLKNHQGVVVSEYWDDVAPGETRNGVMCQDVRRLTFADNSFDMVVSEMVFEHIPDYLNGFRELFRVLKPGGVHLFTIPYDAAIVTTPRFALQNGEWVPILPLELHGDRLRGTIPAYTNFGHDFIDILRTVGFETVLHEPTREEADRYQIYDGRVFLSIKPAS